MRKTNLKDINPELDGIDHIRIDKNASTKLGRMLTIDANRRFYHPNHGFFTSVDSAIMYFKLEKPDDKIRELRGKKLRNYVDEEIANNRNSIKRKFITDDLMDSILTYSISSRHVLLELFCRTSIPFVAYYFDAQEQFRMKDKQMTRSLNRIRKTLKENTCDSN